MILTDHEREILRTVHGKRHESKQIRLKLKEAGLKYCRQCDTVKPCEAFPSTVFECKPCNAKTSNKYYHESKADVSHRRKVYRDLERNHVSSDVEPDPSELLGDSLHFDLEG